MKNFYLWLEDLHALHQNTVSNFPTDRTKAEVREPKLSLTPMPENNELLVKANVPGKDDIYKASILFQNVNYQQLPKDKQLDLYHFLFTNPLNGHKFYIERLSMRGNNVKVDCSCPDFKNTFNTANYSQNALYGASSKLPSKRNPKNVPGLCKHLWRVVQELQQKGILIDSKTLTLMTYL